MGDLSVKKFREAICAEGMLKKMTVAMTRKGTF